MRLSTILKVLVVLIVAVVVGAVVAVANMDFNQYKGLIAEKVKEATGRTLVIDGDIELQLSLTPSLAVSGVKFANADWGTHPQMVTVERFSARVALWPLLSRTIEVRHVLLQGADIFIESDAKGHANFIFETEAKTTASPTTSGPSKTSTAEESLTIPVIEKILIEDARLTYLDGTTGGKQTLSLERVSLTGNGVAEPLDLSFSILVNGQGVNGTGKLGAPTALTDPSVPWSINLSVEAGGARLSAEGEIRDLIGVKGVNLSVGVTGASLAAFSALAGNPLPPLGPYTVSARVLGNLKEQVTVDAIAVKLGKSDIGGNLKVHLGGRRPAISGAFTSNLFDLEDVSKKPAGAGAAQAAPAPKVETGERGRATAAKIRLIPDTSFPVDALKLADAKLDLIARRILASGAVIENAIIGLNLSNGDLVIAPMRAEISKGSLDGKVRLNAPQAKARLAVSLKALNIDLGKLLSDLAVTDLLEGALNAEVDLAGSGGSARELAAGLDGSVKAVIGEGRVKTTALDAFIGGPTGVLTKLITGNRKEFTVLNCVVSHTDIKQGVANLSAGVIDTEYARISAAGKVDLRSEALDILVSPEPKSATLNLAVAVKVGGTLANPSYGLDELSVLRKLGGVAFGLGFPPALLLGLGELGADAESPCLRPVKSGSGKSSPDAEAAPKGGVEGAVKGVTEEAGKLLKGLFGK